jgi:lipopolysaccharide transport system ATP-binding protein
MVNIVETESVGRLSNAYTMEPSSFGTGDVVLAVEGVSKKFCRNLKRSLFYGIQDISSELLGLRKNNNSTLRRHEFWALKNVSFDLRKGEAIALVGRNGSGKSTLLRIISGLIKPDTGSVTVKGRVAPLIALGAGFNPVLTGRENIYANMSVLGLTKQQIDERFDAVVDFSEVGIAIDAPVQSYSSGMAARLGFACAVYTEPDILVIDEVLAVGDVQFRTKCYRRLGELREKGVSFILVSHNPNSVRSLCDSAVYLLGGAVEVIGDTAEVMQQYEADALNLNIEATSGQLIRPPKTAVESPGVDITSLIFMDMKGNQLKSLHSGESARFCLGCQVHRPMDDVRIAITIKGKASEGECILSLSNHQDQARLVLAPGHNLIEMEMPYVGLPPGPYFMNVVVRQGAMEIMDAVQNFDFNVDSNISFYKSKFYQPRLWRTATLTVQPDENVF